jgi:hypothetical protein
MNAQIDLCFHIHLYGLSFHFIVQEYFKSLIAVGLAAKFVITVQLAASDVQEEGVLNLVLQR